jgi:hypothetical protein
LRAGAKSLWIESRFRSKYFSGRKILSEKSATFRDHALSAGVLLGDDALAQNGIRQRSESCPAVVRLGVTAHPSAQWIARQLSEAYGWQQAPQYIVRDRDCVYGDVFIRHPSRSRDGHSGPADRTTIAMAERTCGEAHRFDPTGLS